MTTFIRKGIQRATALALACLAVSLPARADYLWLQPEGGEARVYAGELSKPLTQWPALADAKAVLPEGKALPLETGTGHLSFRPAAGSDQRFTATRAGSDGVLTYYQARFGRAETKGVNDLELVPTEPNGNTFQLIFKGRPANASRVNVETAAGWSKSLTPNADGTVTLDTPIPGLYVLEVSAKVNNASVSIDGKKYEDVRYTATLSFEVGR